MEWATLPCSFSNFSNCQNGRCTACAQDLPALRVININNDKVCWRQSPIDFPSLESWFTTLYFEERPIRTNESNAAAAALPPSRSDNLVRYTLFPHSHQSHVIVAGLELHRAKWDCFLDILCIHNEGHIYRSLLAFLAVSQSKICWQWHMCHIGSNFPLELRPCHDSDAALSLRERRARWGNNKDRRVWFEAFIIFYSIRSAPKWLKFWDNSWCCWIRTTTYVDNKNPRKNAIFRSL